MTDGWTTNVARNADGSFSVFHNASNLAKDIFWHNLAHGSKHGSWHGFSGPTTLGAAFVTAQSILDSCAQVHEVIVRGYDGRTFTFRK